MNWSIYVRGKVRRKLKKFPHGYIEQIERAVDEMRVSPYAGDVQKMEGIKNVWRKRVGSYRIKFEVSDNEKFIYIFEVERRTSKTY